MSSVSDWVAVTTSPWRKRNRITSPAERLSFGPSSWRRTALDDDLDVRHRCVRGGIGRQLGGLELLEVAPAPDRALRCGGRRPGMPPRPPWGGAPVGAPAAPERPPEQPPEGRPPKPPPPDGPPGPPSGAPRPRRGGRRSGAGRRPRAEVTTVRRWVGARHRPVPGGGGIGRPLGVRSAGARPRRWRRGPTRRAERRAGGALTVGCRRGGRVGCLGGGGRSGRRLRCRGGGLRRRGRRRRRRRGRAAAADQAGRAGGARPPRARRREERRRPARRPCGPGPSSPERCSPPSSTRRRRPCGPGRARRPRGRRSRSRARPPARRPVRPPWSPWSPSWPVRAPRAGRGGAGPRRRPCGGRGRLPRPRWRTSGS